MDWTQDDFGALEKGILVARHRLHESGLFTDEGLAKIIDAHPDGQLTITRMGTDTNRFEWREGARNGVAGETLIELVREGRFWLSVRKVNDLQPQVRELVDAVYGELEAHTPGFRTQTRFANLLISSPNALVHYHIDPPVNILWHLRGKKRVFVYPPFDYRFVSQEVIEKVCAGEFTEDVPYHPDFDRYALTFDLEPGQVLTWPQMTPHRVNNFEGLNVSLSIDHRHATIKRRIQIHRANYLLRKWLGPANRSAAVHGVGARLKQALARGYTLWEKVSGRTTKPFSYPHSFKVDPSAPLGYTPLDITEEKLVAPHERMMARM